MEYKLSIITVNKNNSIGLEKTCLSIVTQTFNNFEWIVIDGLSEDNSVEVIKQYSKKINYWVSESDSGIYEGMNKGIKKAKGEFLLFLNSGDILVHPWTLQEVFNEIEDSEYADVYYSNAISENYKVLEFPKKISIEFLKKAHISHQNSLIKRELFNHQLYNENYRIISDWYFFITELIKYNITFFHINTLIAIYDISGVSTKRREQSLSEKQDAITKLGLTGKVNINIVLLIKIHKLVKYILPYGLYKLLYSLIKKIKL